MQRTKTESPAWPDNSVYFLTDATFFHFPYFKTDEQKQIVLNQIKKINQQLGIPVSDYSIAINHYHLKFYLERGSDLMKIKKLLRGGISYEYRKKYEMPYKEMWQTRKVIRITSERMNWKISGYIIGNLLKHKEVSTFEELKQNRFSSLWHMVNKYGDGEMQDLVCRVVDVDEDAWGVVNLSQLDKKN
jgi:hypothetical protein